jgi:ubiquitin carboxyl-terminal hydrolase 10
MNQGGQQEDAEEFLGFFLDTLEEELLSISKALSPNDSVPQVSFQKTESESDWLEVGRKNKAVMTRAVSGAYHGIEIP